DETIVVFTADHGHSLGDHDYSFHHGDFLYESSVRIPLIIRWPDKVPAGLVVGQQVRSIDVAPTLLELARVPAGLNMDGTSLASFWKDANQPPRDAYLESDVKMMAANTRRTVDGVLGKLRALRHGGFKLVMTPSYDGPVFELYDLIQDPEEQNNLAEAEEHHEIFTELLASLLASTPADERAAFTKIDRKAIDGESAGESVLGKSDRELLKALGYIN
ncbi:MAG TPA: sulfatase/phosphatase domain-containing protein, partial [Vicinamibacteria bacterium]|nr:sulfatase/phosphatase domain-containing protein [Vicinamibacteria bacterium]